MRVLRSPMFRLTGIAVFGLAAALQGIVWWDMDYGVFTAPALLIALWLIAAGFACAAWSAWRKRIIAGAGLCAAILLISFIANGVLQQSMAAAALGAARTVGQERGFQVLWYRFRPSRIEPERCEFACDRYWYRFVVDRDGPEPRVYWYD